VNLGKYSLEWFASCRFRVFLRRVVRLTPFTLWRGIGRRDFLWNHHNSAHRYERSKS
jgi:hypothetical protein